MREIEFRGKLTSGTKWAYGGLYKNKKGTVFVRSERADFGIAVQTETVGQYIGLKDKNSVKIFEGDILSWKQPILRNPKTLMGVVKMFYAGYIVEVGIEAPFMWSLSSVHGRGCEVIGNIHDNPELLEEQE